MRCLNKFKKIKYFYYDTQELQFVRNYYEYSAKITILWDNK